MVKGKLIAICYSGGKFTTNDDGSLSYSGGDAHAINVNNESRFDELKSEMAEMWNYDPNSMTIKYFLPNNKRTLITISSDKDIQHMIDFHEDSATVNVYVMTRENPASDISTIPCSSSSRTSVVELSTPLQILPPVITDVVDVGQQKVTKLWGNCITGVDQQFDSVNDFRVALRKYSIARGFKYTFKCNDADFVMAYCKSEGCPWRIHASKLCRTQLFRIRKMNDTHTCGAGTSTTNRPNASQKLVASIIKEKLLDTPNCKPREIADAIQQEFGIELDYNQAWRGVECAKQELRDLYRDAYNQLPWLCEKIVETNPGSVATLSVKEDLSFHRLFIAFHGSLYGFLNGCRPLIFLDSLTLKSKYQSELVTATALDGNDDIFPVAFAVVDAVNDHNWHWFLVQLKSALSTDQPITFVADRLIGLRESISSIFENSYHGYCLHHLMEELQRDMKSPCTEEVLRVIIAHFCDAAYAATVDEFRKCLGCMKNISPEACEWVLQREPQHWANALSEVPRYRKMRSDIARSFFSWVTELPPLLITEVIDGMCRKIMDLICARRLDSNQWSTRLTPTFENKLQEDIIAASSLQVLLSPTISTFEVCDDLGVIYVVNIDRWDCSCREWQITGLPCLHALAVLQRFERSIYNYCSQFFMTETCRIIFSESIIPIAMEDMPKQRKSSPVCVNPPALRHPSGSGQPNLKRIWPKKRRHPSKGPARPLHCSRCKGVGHNRATCHISS